MNTQFTYTLDNIPDTRHDVMEALKDFRASGYELHVSLVSTNKTLYKEYERLVLLQETLNSPDDFELTAFDIQQKAYKMELTECELTCGVSFDEPTEYDVEYTDEDYRYTTSDFTEETNEMTPTEQWFYVQDSAEHYDLEQEDNDCTEGSYERWVDDEEEWERVQLPAEQQYAGTDHDAPCNDEWDDDYGDEVDIYGNKIEQPTDDSMGFDDEDVDRDYVQLLSDTLTNNKVDHKHVVREEKECECFPFYPVTAASIQQPHGLYNSMTKQYETANVPEPSTLFALGAFGLALLGKSYAVIATTERTVQEWWTEPKRREQRLLTLQLLLAVMWSAWLVFIHYVLPISGKIAVATAKAVGQATYYLLKQGHKLARFIISQYHSTPEYNEQLRQATLQHRIRLTNWMLYANEKRYALQAVVCQGLGCISRLSRFSHDALRHVRR